MERDGWSRWLDFFAADGVKLVRYIRKRILSISDMDAEDIVGDVMLSVLNMAETSGPVENIAGYVYRSLHNKAIDYQRRSSRTLSLQACLDAEGEVPLMELLAGGSSELASGLERKEFMQRLGQAISRLEPRQRAVFIATELNGMSFRALSEQWHEPMGTLLSRKSRAVKALRGMLSDFADE